MTKVDIFLFFVILLNYAALYFKYEEKGDNLYKTFVNVSMMGFGVGALLCYLYDAFHG